MCYIIWYAIKYVTYMLLYIHILQKIWGYPLYIPFIVNWNAYKNETLAFSFC